MNLPNPGATANLKTNEDWRAVFSAFSHIVLIANSEAIDMAALQKDYPETALFVFFNRVYKVLGKPFSGRSLLISRAQPKGANIVYRGEVADVVNLLSPERFLGIMNVRLQMTEKLNTQADYLDTPTGHLDLTDFCADFYPSEKVPTTGFAMSLWLVDQKLPARIVLAGFSAKRSEKWRVVSVHDWTFEQVFLRLFARVGKLSMHDGIARNSYAELASRFPELSAAEISSTVADVVSRRLSETDAQVDKLISLTNVLRSADLFLRRLKPGFLKKRTSDK
ncbi:3-deoxy-manno-octulosonate cytidylyltransferase [Pararhizobium sp. BT-229]|uniref:3-deoxy-manno-octulosonate cytidylyltransferase n=1 Tax=Pararhizobium sp. BT-229 TaxID=2986923 RepID=UPI0021F7D53F|nr:3-deoxy-manno-octulosonate cytidylyltransferase [Pararhizobium sp. BT-229]MCV9966698.1 3-deoxy-manno-octulosonate cytidylyltransferase [Pararhizobium sp. BT-229]